MCVYMYFHIAMNSSYMITPTTLPAKDQKNQPVESDIVSKMFICFSNYRYTQALRSTSVYLFVCCFLPVNPNHCSSVTIY